MIYSKAMATEKTTTIRVKPDTKKQLDALRHPGQTFDGVIKELLLKKEV